jgi:hypothetical protein
MDVLAACLGTGTQPPANPRRMDSARPVPSDRCDTGTLPRDTPQVHPCSLFKNVPVFEGLWGGCPYPSSVLWILTEVSCYDLRSNAPSTNE